MTLPDHHIHLARRDFDALWDREGTDGLPFSEDAEAIDKLIADELGAPKRRRRRRVK